MVGRVGRGQSLELFFVNGDPEGMLTAEIFNWRGRLLVTPRTRIVEALRREEASFTGVYVLTGEEADRPTIYIGQAENVSDRIRSHDAGKDWWDTAVIITASGNTLNKAHVQYLEARLVELARQAGRAALDNGNGPRRPGLSEADIAKMEEFLDYVALALPAIGVSAFNSRKRSNPVATEPKPLDPSPVAFELVSDKHGLRADALLVDGEFVVQAGSDAREEWASKDDTHTYARLYAELVNDGVLVPALGKRTFATSYAFKKPSAAAAVVLGRPANGRTEWRRAGSNQTYEQYEASELNQVRPESE
jgi:hypothetical protein